MDCNQSWKCRAGSIPYTIREGDTLYAISKLYRTTPERLLEVNPGIVAENLQIGSVICIPQPTQYYPNCRTTNYYIVKDTDTVYSIAQYFGVDVRQILYSNIGIEPENIYEGMVLCIPIAPPPLSVHIKGNILTLAYNSGETETVSALGGNLSSVCTAVVQKELDTAFSGKKMLNLSIPETAITNVKRKGRNNDIILSDKDMNRIFNLVPIGTEVAFD